jgi:hypothetical protein
VDFRKFERNLVWKEFFFGKEPDEEYKPISQKIIKPQMV